MDKNSLENKFQSTKNDLKKEMKHRFENISEDIEEGADKTKDFLVNKTADGEELYNTVVDKTKSEYNDLKSKFYKAKSEFYDHKNH